MKALLVWLLLLAKIEAASLTVATYNLEFYIDAPALGVPPKSEQARKVIRESIRATEADVIALQEMGSSNALEELRASLRAEGADFPFAEYVRGWDHNLHLAFLSKFPITARRPHTNESFLFEGRRFRVGRGFGEVEIEIEKGLRVTLMTAHLKSKRQVAEADQQGLREEEAVLLREKIDEFFSRSTEGYLIVLGDFNDGIRSRTLRTIIGRGRKRLIDLRPSERTDRASSGSRPVVWTHFYANEEIYSRIDFILISPSLQRHFRPEASYILDLPNWGIGSDHRPIRAKFEFEQRADRTQKRQKN